MSTEREGSPDTRVEVDIHGGATRGDNCTRVDVSTQAGAAGSASCTRVAGVETTIILSSDEAHNERENVEDVVAQHNASHRGASTLGGI